MNAAVTAPVTTAQEFNTVQFQKRETSLCDDFFSFFFSLKRKNIPPSKCLSSILAFFCSPFIKAGKPRQGKSWAGVTAASLHLLPRVPVNPQEGAV